MVGIGRFYLEIEAERKRQDEKHPVFFDEITREDIEIIQNRLEYVRKDKSLYGVVHEELLEAIEAALLQEVEAEEKEVVQLGALALRWWENIQKKKNKN